MPQPVIFHPDFYVPLSVTLVGIFISFVLAMWYDRSRRRIERDDRLTRRKDDWREDKKCLLHRFENEIIRMQCQATKFPNELEQQRSIEREKRTFEHLRIFGDVWNSAVHSGRLHTMLTDEKFRLLQIVYGNAWRYNDSLSSRDVDLLLKLCEDVNSSATEALTKLKH